MMNEEDIKQAFDKAISVRGISKQLDISRSRVSHWRNDEKVPFSTMLEVLYKLDKIKILPNDEAGTAAG
ncbi:MAG: hypothetical protein BM557_01345 [Flavobacterium sp. MedPE-SWcel]|uniref:hypothetical protein n=1 Tax=uncultured Flavobacterium sp. TaxID=165435 RepID=UPI000914F72B|nr:hypothetical protein [uncultured Flavobacterium sp.]OIQ22051.1 MAG: hypothetical protein BM557_01345 [Flavobacterium sp. MedPE-SWcel]